jgi:hypothetical protein
VLATVVLGAGAARAQTAASGSQASNYGYAPHVSVNARTGGVSATVELFRLRGVVPTMDAALVLTCQSDQAVAGPTATSGVFGLPLGWGLDPAYVTAGDTSTAGDPVVHVDGTETYPVDASRILTDDRCRPQPSLHGTG